MSPNPYAAYVFRSTGAHISALRFLQFLLPSLGDLGGDVGRRVLIDVELHAVAPPAVRQRGQRRRVPVQLRFGNEPLDLRETPVFLRTEDVPAARGDVTHHRALVLIGSPYLDLHDPLNQDQPAVP